VRFDSREGLETTGAIGALPPGVTIAEGDDALLAVALTSRPQASVRVSLNATDLGIVPSDARSSLSLQGLQFDHENWNIPQVVSVNTVSDGIASPARSPVTVDARLEAFGTSDSVYSSLAASANASVSLQLVLSETDRIGIFV